MDDINQQALDAIHEQPEVDLNALASQMGLKTHEAAPKFQPNEADVKAVMSHPDTKTHPKDAAAQAGPTDAELALGDTPAMPTAQQAKDTTGVATEALRGAARALQNTWNGALDVVNGFSKYAGLQGESQGDLIPSGARANFEMLKSPENMSPAEKFGSMAGQLAVPVVSAMATGGGALAQLAVGAGVDFAAMDPHQERLSKMLIENYPEFRHTAVMGNMLEWMGENNPGHETELEGRLKNMIEGVTLGGGMMGAVEVASKMFGGTIKLARATKAYMNEAPGGVKSIEQAVTAQAPNIAQEAELAAIESKLGANASTTENTYPDFRPATPEEQTQISTLTEQAAIAKTPEEAAAAKEQLTTLQQGRIVDKPVPDIVNPAVVIKDTEGVERINPHSQQIDAIIDPPQGPGFESRTWADIRKGADAIAASGDPEEIAARLLKQDAKVKPYTPEEQQFLAQHIAPKMEAATQAIEDQWIAMVKADAPEAAEKFLELNNARARTDLVKARIAEHGSEAGLRLNMQKDLGELAVARQRINAQVQADLVPLVQAHVEVSALQAASAAENKAAQEAVAQAEQAAVKAREVAVAPGAAPELTAAADEAAAKFQEAKNVAEQKKAALDIADKAAGETGQKVAAGQAKAARAGDNKFKDQFDLLRDARFRKAFKEEIIQKYGGEENIKQLATYLEIAKALPPGQSEVALRELRNSLKGGPIDKIMEKMTSYTRAALLSSPRTAEGVFLEISAASGASVMNNFWSNVLQGAGALRVPGFKRFAVVDKSAADAMYAIHDFTAGMAHEFASNLWGIGHVYAKMNPEGVAGSMAAYKEMKVYSTPLKKYFDTGITPQTLWGNMLQKGGKVLDSTLGFGQKAVGTVDAFFTDSIRNAKLRAQYMGEARDLVERGVIKSEGVSKYVNDRLAAPRTEDWDAANAFAKEHVMMKPYADSGTPGSAAKFTSDIANTLGGGTLQEGGMKSLAQFFSPFMRTAYNVLDFSLQHTLLAPLWNHSVTGRAILQGGEAGADATARMLTGTSLLGLGAVLAHSGVVTGSEPDNPRLAKALRESSAGWQPNSIKIGDTYMEMHRLGMLGRVLGMGGDLYSMLHHVDENTAGASAMLMASSFAHHMNPADMARGMGEIYTLLSNPRTDQNAVEKFIAGNANKFVPAVMTDLRKAADPYRHDVSMQEGDTIMQGIKNSFRDKVPMWSREGAIDRNIWGEPQLNSPASFAIPVAISSAENGSPVKEVLEKFAHYELGAPPEEQLLKLALGMPPRTLQINGANVPLSNAEYEKYVLLSAGLRPDKDAKPGKEDSWTMPLKDVVEQQSAGIYAALKGQEVSPVVYKTFMNQLTGTVKAYRAQAKQYMMMDADFAKKVNVVTKSQLEAVNVGF